MPVIQGSLLDALCDLHSKRESIAILIIDELSTGPQVHISDMQRVINCALSLNIPIIIVESDTRLDPGSLQLPSQPTHEALRNKANSIFIKLGINAFSTRVVSSSVRDRLVRVGKSIDQLHTEQEARGYLPSSELHRCQEARGVKTLVMMGASTNLCLQASIAGYCQPFIIHPELAALPFGYKVISCPQIIRGMIANEIPDWQNLEDVSLYSSL